MSAGKLKYMKFKASHFWGEKRPTKHAKNSGDRIPTMLGLYGPIVGIRSSDF